MTGSKSRKLFLSLPREDRKTPRTVGSFSPAAARVPNIHGRRRPFGGTQQSMRFEFRIAAALLAAAVASDAGVHDPVVAQPRFDLDLVDAVPFDGSRYLQRTGDGGGRALFESQAESWLTTLWAAVRAKLPPALARLAPGGRVFARENSTTAANASTLDLASLFRRALVPSSFSWHPETLVAGLWNVTVPQTHARHNGMTIMSGGNRDPHGAHEKVIENHRAFAQSRGYSYWWHAGSMVAEQGWQPYWSKIAQLRRRMQRHPEEKAWVWIDDDIVLTNHRTDMFEAALERYPNASVLVTADAWAEASALNTGIIIVRNDERAREIMEELWHLATEPREDGLSLAHASQRLCLHEQEALASLAQRTRCGSGGIEVLPQRADGDAAGFNLNTFLRWSHFDGTRDQLQIYDQDTAASQWRHGDFAGHCTGLSYLRRGLCVRTLLASVIDGEGPEERTPTAPSPSLLLGSLPDLSAATGYWETADPRTGAAVDRSI